MASQASIDLLIEQLARLNERIDGLSHDVAALQTKPTTSLTPSPSPKVMPHICLDFPRIDGSNAVTRFFEYYQISEIEQLKLLPFYMDGPALSWFQWMERNNMLRTWPKFLHSLETRFAPSHFHNIKGCLCKLSQTNSVLQYLTEFESLANRIIDVPSSFMLECFISSLRPDIQREVLAFQPVTFSEAAELAKL